MHFFDRTLYLQICIWKQSFSLGKDERYRLTFDWRFSALSQSEIRVHWWTHNSKNPTNLGRREFNSTLHQSSHGFATRVHGFATKTKALTHEIPPATQANFFLLIERSAKRDMGHMLLPNNRIGSRETWLSPYSIWGCCVTTVGRFEFIIIKVCCMGT